MCSGKENNEYINDLPCGNNKNKQKLTLTQAEGSESGGLMGPCIPSGIKKPNMADFITQSGLNLIKVEQPDW